MLRKRSFLKSSGRKWFKRAEIGGVAWTEEDIRLLAGAVGELMSVNGDAAPANHFQAIALHDNRRSLINADTQQFGIEANHLHEIVLSPADEQVLIDRGSTQ